MTVTRPAGFVAAGGGCGIKPGGAFDLAVVATADGAPVPGAAVFTSNRACAAPVTLSRRHLAASAGRVAAVVVNSGNANAATGAPGLADAARMAELTAKGIGCAAEEVLVCSTGLIGFRLPMDRLEAGLPAVVAARAAGPEAGDAAARAIMTTDTRPKVVARTGNGFVVGGIAKGAAMLAPDMATMLAVLTTDAAVEPVPLRAMLRDAVAASFNRLSVDGCTSTNDTVIVMASGASRSGPAPDSDEVARALADACADLAQQMADDAEGATRVARVIVTGAADDTEAAIAARKVAESQLVQCSLHGADPYWGRVVSELGSAGVAFEMDRVEVSYGPVTVCRGGVAVDHDRDAVAAHLAERHVELRADLGLGPGRAAMLTTALSPAYIAENERTS
ncbi:MAG TPA: bifunctional glutamate N-acetyltransferase/amino-acid acetyltransferase ArgJ [Acidimicrobiales bacterium]|nr:bifunctional glutamate N-acetyltransferase/amino-acid acetyltransferase ArgJ [Acidimicrobiales bacterium]